MARVAGIDLPKNKRIDIALEYIYGIGKKNAKEVLAKLNGQIDPATRVKDLTERQVAQNIHRAIEIGSYRGQRHRRNLPVRGQRTKTNSRTRRGRRKTVGSKTK